MRHIISILIENESGALSRVAAQKKLLQSEGVLLDKTQ